MRKNIGKRKRKQVIRETNKQTIYIIINLQCLLGCTGPRRPHIIEERDAVPSNISTQNDFTIKM